MHVSHFSTDSEQVRVCSAFTLEIAVLKTQNQLYSNESACILKYSVLGFAVDGQHGAVCKWELLSAAKNANKLMMASRQFSGNPGKIDNKKNEKYYWIFDKTLLISCVKLPWLLLDICLHCTNCKNNEWMKPGDNCTSSFYKYAPKHNVMWRGAVKVFCEQHSLNTVPAEPRLSNQSEQDAVSDRSSWLYFWPDVTMADLQTRKRLTPALGQNIKSSCLPVKKN